MAAFSLPGTGPFLLHLGEPALCKLPRSCGMTCYPGMDQYFNRSGGMHKKRPYVS